MVWGMGDASGLKVFETHIGRLGGLICWEHWMPLARYALYASGEQIHTALWPARDPELLQIACRHIALEGRVFVVAACGYMTRSMLPEDFELAEEAVEWPEVILHGGSAIIGPDGSYLAGPALEGQTILYADIDLERIIEEKHDLDVVGHYSRPDILRLMINDAPLTPVVSGDLDALRQKKNHITQEVERLLSTQGGPSAEKILEVLQNLKRMTPQEEQKQF